MTYNVKLSLFIFDHYGLHSSLIYTEQLRAYCKI